MVAPYEGVHAFIFIREVDPGDGIRAIVARLEDQGLVNKDAGPVFFASDFAGAFKGFVHAGADDLTALLDLLAGQLWDAGVHCEPALEGTVSGADTAQPLGPKRRSPPYCALVRIDLRRDTSVDPLEVLSRLRDVSLFQGASIVFGDFDILLELGADDYDSLTEAVRTWAKDFPEVERSRSAITHVSRDWGDELG